MPQQQEEITLTLHPSQAQEQVEEQPAQVEPQSQAQSEEPRVLSVEEQIQQANLTPQEVDAVRQFAEKIDVYDSTMILEYGSIAQQKVSNFSDKALKDVRTKDLGQVGDLMVKLVADLKQASKPQESKSGLFGWLSKQGEKASNVLTRYDDASKNVDRIASMLSDSQIELMKDIQMLDQLYEKNAQNAKELTMYILAGKAKLEQLKNEELPRLTSVAQQSGKPEDVQAANDLNQAIDRFEKKLYDLELTRQISIQMAPQIRLVQNNDTLMTQKIQSTLVNTIPLWKNQIVLALGIAHSKEAMEAQRSVNNLTNDLLKHNAQVLKQATIDTAKEFERGIVDIETLTTTNEQLISTLDEVMKIQQEGRTKRQAAEAELRRIEQTLNEKLLHYQDTSKQ